MKTSLICLLALFIDVNASFSQTVSQESMKIKSAYAQLKIYPGSKPKQQAYMSVFPQNKQQFTEVFQPSDNGQLAANSRDFIHGFLGLAQNFPTEVIDKAVNIGKDLAFQAGASETMQHGILELGLQNTKIFANKVKALPANEQTSLFKFLAGSQKEDPQYKELIEALNKAGEVKLSNMLVDARQQEEKSKGH